MYVTKPIDKQDTQVDNVSIMSTEMIRNTNIDPRSYSDIVPGNFIYVTSPTDDIRRAAQQTRHMQTAEFDAAASYELKNESHDLTRHLGKASIAGIDYTTYQVSAFADSFANGALGAAQEIFGANVSPKRPPSRLVGQYALAA